MTTIQNGTSHVVSQDLMQSVNSTKKAAEAGSVEEATDKFMTLLVTQLKNQDPLNPLDNAQITSQLAQLSTVTGVNNLNKTVESLRGDYLKAEQLQAAGMIGHGVLTVGSAVNLEQGKAILGMELATPADKLEVIISNAAGKEIQTIALGPKQAGAFPFVWDGSSAIDSVLAGAQAPDGKYGFKIVASRGGEPLTDVTKLTFGVINSVSTSAKDGLKLNIPTLGELKMSDVKQIL